jgi:hypothetical protein
VLAVGRDAAAGHDHVDMGTVGYTEQPGELGVWINDRLIASGALWPMRGGVKASLVWLREHLAENGRVGAHVISLGASHLSLISHSTEVAGVIELATRGQ